MKAIVGATVVALAVLGSIAPCEADDDLKALLDKPTCKKWKEISTATLAQLRKANASGGKVDLKLIELSYTLMDYCMEASSVPPPRPNGPTIITGLGASEDAMKQMTRRLAAILAYYKEAQAAGPMGPATSLKTWPQLSAVAIGIVPDLRALVEHKFGTGAFEQYMRISETPVMKRSTAEQQSYVDMRPWLEPL